MFLLPASEWLSLGKDLLYVVGGFIIRHILPSSNCKKSDDINDTKKV